MKIEKKTTPKSSSKTSEKEKVNVKSEKSKSSIDDSVDKKESVKTEQESPQPKKATGIHSFFTNTKTAKDQSTNGGVSGVEYNPGKTKYHPIDDAFWKHGEKYDLCDYMTPHPCNNNFHYLNFQSSILGVGTNFRNN